MTTEVAVLNKFGIALAADSAVTVDHWHQNKIHTKVYNTANKLFTLSKFQPVGIMYYNTVTLGGLPWETIIKVYRKNLARSKFDTLNDYAVDFFKWLSAGSIFSEAMVKDIVETTIIRALVGLEGDAKSKAKFGTALNAKADELRNLPDIDGFDDAFRDRIKKEYKSSILGCIKSCVKRSHAAGQSAKILDYVALLLTKKKQLSGYSGIVIAGFGEHEALPSLQEFVVDLVVLDRVRFWRKNVVTINESNSSQVVPLADDEVIKTLITGISPSFAQVTMLGAISVLAALPAKIIDPIVELTPAQKAKYIADANNTVPQHFRDFSKRMADYRDKTYTRPIKQAIASLSIGDLAMVAETFLGASQFKSACCRS